MQHKKSRCFVVVLLAVLFLSYCSVFRVGVVFAGAPAGTITYNAGTDTITVIGANSTHPAEFLDLYNADVSGGWNQVFMQNSTQFSFDCKIIIGNGTAETYFSDINKQVKMDVFAGSNGYNILVKNNATFTLGTLINATTKATKQGCSVIRIADNTDGTYVIGSDGTTAKIYLYSSQIQALAAWTSVGGWITQGGVADNLRLYNCVLDGVMLRDTSSTTYNTVFSNTQRPFFVVDGSYDKVSVFGCDYGVFTWFGEEVTISNSIIKNSGTKDFWMAATTTSGNIYAINTVSDWTTEFSGDCSGKIYRQSTFDLYVLNGNLTDFVESANVTLTHDGTVFGSWLTNSTGQISTQTLTYGFYNQTGGDTMYGGTAWTLTITHDDWANYTSAFYPYAKMDWSISMQDPSTSEDDAVSYAIIAGLISAVIAAVVVGGFFLSRRE